VILKKVEWKRRGSGRGHVVLHSCTGIEAVSGFAVDARLWGGRRDLCGTHTDVAAVLESSLSLAACLLYSSQSAFKLRHPERKNTSLLVIESILYSITESHKNIWFSRN
jgi:hypothetical protein